MQMLSSIPLDPDAKFAPKTPIPYVDELSHSRCALSARDLDPSRLNVCTVKPNSEQKRWPKITKTQGKSASFQAFHEEFAQNPRSVMFATTSSAVSLPMSSMARDERDSEL